MKKFIRVEDFLVAFISCLGYGIGYAFPKMWEQSMVVCIISCMVLGMIMDVVGARLIRTKWAQRSTTNKILTAIATVGVFLLITMLGPKLLKETLWEYLKEQL